MDEPAAVSGRPSMFLDEVEISLSHPLVMGYVAAVARGLPPRDAAGGGASPLRRLPGTVLLGMGTRFGAVPIGAVPGSLPPPLACDESP